MTAVVPQSVSIRLDDGQRVSGLLQAPPDASACCVLAHGAGAGMGHPFMAAIADGLAGRGIAVVRYQFPYMERGGRRPDAPALAQATVRAAVTEAARLVPGCAIFAGGKSFGGRMTSEAQAASPMPGVRGLVFLGFPLHPAGRPSAERGRHLLAVNLPMLFLQGTRDALAELTRVQALVEQLGPRARLELVPEGDHSFHLPARAGRTDVEARAGILDALTGWINEVLSVAAGRVR